MAAIIDSRRLSEMAKNYGWTGMLRHGLWKCGCGHWNYYRTVTLRIDSHCNNQGCSYRARVVLDREERKGGRPRQVVVHEYPNYRPPRTVKQEQRERNRWERRGRELFERMDIKKDRGVFMKASELQDAQDVRDLKISGGIWRLKARPDLKRHPSLGDSRLTLNKKGANNSENDPQE